MSETMDLTRKNLQSKYSDVELRDINRRLMESNKDVSIKEATDDQLEKIAYRLDLEERVQSLVKRVKRNTMNEFEKVNSDLPISTETPIKDLYHYGVKGMKWGVIRGSKARISRARAKLKSKIEDRAKRRVESKDKARNSILKKGSEDYERAKGLKRKRLSDMSNKEIEDLTRRLQLETNYRRLNPQTKSRGRQLIEATVKTVGKQAAEEFNKQFVKPRVEKIMSDLIKKAAR